MKRYTKSGEIHPCRLQRNDLLRLSEIVKETFPISDREEDFQVSTNLPNISINENSIEDFLKHEELPDKFNELSIEIKGWSENREIDKSVRMTFSRLYMDLYVDGTDETWVLGKYSQIANFLRERRPWFWAVHKVFPFISGIIFVLSLAGLTYFIKAEEIIYSISTALFLTAWIFATVFYLKGTFLPYTQIILTPKESFFNKQNVTVIIAVLSLIVSIIGGVIIPLVK